MNIGNNLIGNFREINMVLRYVLVVMLFGLMPNSYGMNNPRVHASQDKPADSGAGIGLSARDLSGADAKRAQQTGVEHKNEHAAQQEYAQGHGYDTVDDFLKDFDDAFGRDERPARAGAKPVQLDVEQYTGPTVSTEPLDEALRTSVLEHCPEEVRELRDQWNVTTQRNQMQQAKTKEERERIQTEMINHCKRLRKKVVLKGPPGTGKSTIGKAIAGACSMPYYFYGAPLLFSRYKNSGSENLSKIFRELDNLNTPCVVIIDEISTIFKQHNNSVDTENGTLAALWILLDEYKNKPILFIATFNEMIGAPEPFIDRFSGKMITVDLPIQGVRQQLLRHYMTQRQATEININLKQLAELTEGFSHRKIEDLVEGATARYLRPGVTVLPATMQDYTAQIEAIKKTKKSKASEDRTEQLKQFGKQWGVPIALGVGSLGFAAWQKRQGDKRQDKLDQDTRKFQLEQQEFQRKQQELQRQQDEFNKKMHEKQQSWGTWVFNHGTDMVKQGLLILLQRKLSKQPGTDAGTSSGPKQSSASPS